MDIKQKKQKKDLVNRNRGTTLIEIVVAVGLVSLLIMTLYATLFRAVNLLGDAKQKSNATSLANEKMEVIRSLEYSQVGLVGWIPAGPIESREEVSRNNLEYTVDTFINYIDDPFDGTAVGGDDDIPTDYKLVEVQVSWNFGGETKSVRLASNFVPNGIETNGGGGILSVNVFDLEGSPISGATVTVDSAEDSPEILGSKNTDSTGNALIPSLPQQEYQITVAKDGYETVQTYPNDAGFTPVDPNIIVVEGDLVAKTFIVDHNADLTISALNVSDEPISGIDVEVEGGRAIGTDPDTFSFSETEATDSDGQIEWTDLSPGSYEIKNFLALENSEYICVDAQEGSIIDLEPEESETVTLLFAPKDQNSLFVRVLDEGSPDAVADAEVVLTKDDFEQTGYSDSNGLVYFPIEEDPAVTMEEGSYSIEVTMDGFENFSDSVSVSGLTQTEVVLERVL